jgi:mutator protein MutT
MKTTLCFLVRKDRVCLTMKKRRFGAGKWNGVGGKLEDGETIEQSALREIREEIGVTVSPEDLHEVGQIDFVYEDAPDWNNYVHIFLTEKWRGEPAESEEMMPKWFEKNHLPFENMWVDDQHWLPLILSGKKIQGEFHFLEKGKKLSQFSVREKA